MMHIEADEYRSTDRSKLVREYQPTAPGILPRLRSTRIVVAVSRDTITLDLLGLDSPSEPESHAASSGIDVGRYAKITVRLAPRIARKMATQARAAGLSHGIYLSTLIAGAPAVLTGADHRRAVAALTASNDEIARMATDLNGLARLLRRGTMPSAGEVEATLEALSSEVRAHVRYASRLLADLAPLAAGVGRSSGRIEERNAREVHQAWPVAEARQTQSDVRRPLKKVASAGAGPMPDLGR